MIEIVTQVRDTCPFCKRQIGVFYLPYADEDRELSLRHKLFQLVKTKIWGTRKQRSIKQMRLYWSACGFLADHTDHKQWNTKDKIDFQCRVAAHFVDPDTVVVKKDGTIAYKYRSIAIKNLAHIEACNYFNQAFQTHVDFWNATHSVKINSKGDMTPVDVWVDMVKQSMVGGG